MTRFSNMLQKHYRPFVFVGVGGVLLGLVVGVAHEVRAFR